jgi:hypothetical protein
MEGQVDGSVVAMFTKQDILEISVLRTASIQVGFMVFSYIYMLLM